MHNSSYPPGSDLGPQLAPSQEERVMAALAHASILVHQIGLIGPLVLWLVNQGKAPFASYQAQQAFWFHLAITVIEWVALLFCVFTLGLGLLVMWPFLILFPLLTTIYGIVGAIHAYNGRDFRYWLIGDMIRP
jgi:uncharacterized Tic20 family protein